MDLITSIYVWVAVIYTAWRLGRLASWVLCGGLEEWAHERFDK